MTTGNQTASVSVLRRKFLSLLSATGAGFGALSLVGRGQARDVGEMTAASFRPLVGTSFSVEDEQGQRATVELIEVEIHPSDMNRPQEVRRDPFSLMFYAPRQKEFTGRTCCMTHPRLGRIDVFLSNVERPKQGMMLQAVFA